MAMRWIVVPSAAALLATAMVCAPTACADEGSFLSELSINGALLPGKTDREVVTAGYQTCGELRSGTSVLDEMSAVEQRYNFSQGTLFVSASTTNLCPDFAAG
jgi:hypothetical protein